MKMGGGPGSLEYPSQVTRTGIYTGTRDRVLELRVTSVKFELCSQDRLKHLEHTCVHDQPYTSSMTVYTPTTSDIYWTTVYGPDGVLMFILIFQFLFRVVLLKYGLLPKVFLGQDVHPDGGEV